MIAVTGNDEVNLVVSMLAKMEYGVGRVVARVNNPANAWMFDASMGVDVAIDQADLITRSVEEGLDIEDVYTIMALGPRAATLLSKARCAPVPRWLGRRCATCSCLRTLCLWPSSVTGILLSPMAARSSAQVIAWLRSPTILAGIF